MFPQFAEKIKTMGEHKRTETCYSFPPIITPQARVLILGSMPGQASLQLQQYYAHPRNIFWRLMGEFFGACLELPYSQRTQILSTRGVAVWDVLKSCDRPGSLDTNINTKSIQVNDFRTVFLQYPNISHIYFNGAKAADLYCRYVETKINTSQNLHYQRLPSTSPANASLSYMQKRDAWQRVPNQLSVIKNGRNIGVR